MFAIPSNGYKTEDNLEGKRHCILVAASNPFPFPIPVYRPNFDGCGDASAIYNAETVAGWFGQCCVSLSIICPYRSPRIRALYEAGKRNSNSEDQPVHSQHPNFLVLISEDFKEARVALNPTTLAPYQDAAPSHSDPNASTTYQPETLNMLGCQTSSPSLVCLDLIRNNENMEMSPSSLTMLNNAADVFHAQENALLAFRDIASLGSQSTGNGNFSNMMPALQAALSARKASSSMVSGFQVETGTSQHVKNSAVSSKSTTEFEPSPRLLQPSSNPQGSTTGIMDSTEASFNQVNTAQLEGSFGMNPVTTMNLGSTDVASSTQIPALGITQELNLGEQSDGSNYSSVSKPVSQETPNCLPTKQCNYAKVWEGKLFALRQGNAVFITFLEAYKKGLAPATFGADWPDSILIERLMLQDRVNDEYKGRRAIVLAFRVVKQHAFINQLFVRKLCAVVELPSEQLLLSVSDKQTRLVGMLFPKDAQTSSASAAVVEQQQL